MPQYDYTHGNLEEMLDIVIDSGAKLFVSAVGVPPRWAVDKLHKAGVLYMNMIGHPKVRPATAHLYARAWPQRPWKPRLTADDLFWYRSMYTRRVRPVQTSYAPREARLVATLVTFPRGIQSTMEEFLS